MIDAVTHSLRLLPRAVLAVALVLAIPAAAYAHAHLDNADPGPDEVVTEVPDELVATFTQDLDASRSSMELRNADGDVVATGEKDPNEARTMRMPLPTLEVGTYEVLWTSFSAEDGELDRGTYTFTVEATATPSPSPSPSPSAAATASASATPAATPSPSPSASPAASAAPSSGGTGGDAGAALLPIVAAVAVAGGLGVWLLRGRAR
jgi:methionine-rich copper-binding protein CopC